MLIPLIAAVDFMNFTYAKHPCPENVPVPAVMRKGSFSFEDRTMGTGFDLHVSSVKEGALRPGTRQAVVVIACDFPVGGTSAAYVYDAHGTAATLLGQVASADWGSDWGAGPSTIGVRFANRLLYVDQCKSNDCGVRTVTTYALRAGKLVKTAVRSYMSERRGRSPALA
ncbi:MAG TPA: hypothetical protein VK669_10700 [Candidatus Limnocylindrales bacterium]|nr:hypothetical protein [Candidatus Limnocylindrales bacterium]